MGLRYEQTYHPRNGLLNYELVAATWLIRVRSVPVEELSNQSLSVVSGLFEFQNPKQNSRYRDTWQSANIRVSNKKQIQHKLESEINSKIMNDKNSWLKSFRPSPFQQKKTFRNFQLHTNQKNHQPSKSVHDVPKKVTCTNFSSIRKFVKWFSRFWTYTLCNSHDYILCHREGVITWPSNTMVTIIHL